MLTRLLLILLFTAAFSAPLAASPILIEEFHLTLPDSISVNSEIKFMDVNADSRMDVLVLRPDRIASVEIESGEIIDNFYPVARGWGERTEVGQFNSDDKMDLAFVKRLPTHADSLGVIIWRSNMSGFVVDTFVVPFSVHDSIKYIRPIVNIDKNGDSIDELYCGYYWESCMYDYHSMWCNEGTETFVFDPAIELIATDIEIPRPLTHRYQYLGERTDVAIERIYSTTIQHAVISSSETRITVFRNLTSSFVDWLKCPFTFHLDVPDYVSEEALCWATCLTNLLGAPEEPELVVAQANSIGSTYGYVEPQSSRELRCFTISDADSLVELWNVPWQYIYGIFSLFDRPGVFYTVELNNKVIERNAATGLPIGGGDFTGAKPEYYVGLIEYDGEQLVAFHKNADIWFYRVGIATDVEDDVSDGKLPGSFVLSKPYPNPFNAEVTIPIAVLSPGELHVDLFNTAGQHIESLFDGRVGSGELTLQWQAEPYASGVYFIRVKMGDETAGAKLQLVK